MRKEIKMFHIGVSEGGNQDWLTDPFMRLGGCAAVTACDCAIYFDLNFGTALYPFEITQVQKQDYVKFTSVMKPYLHPRMSGINKTNIFVDGFGAFLKDSGEERITVCAFDSAKSEDEAFEAVKRQINRGLPIPYLNLINRDKRLKEYEWHWFLLTGYAEYDDGRMVRALTYSTPEWIDFSALWNTGFSQKGGMIIFNTENSNEEI